VQYSQRYGPPQATPSAETWQFDVASIRVSNPNATVRDSRIDFPSLNRLEVQNMTVVEILRAMLGFSSLGEVRGSPKWVEMRSRGPSGHAQRNRDEFAAKSIQVVIHKESLERPGLALILSPGSAPSLQTSADGAVPVFGRNDKGRIVFQSIDMFSFANYLSQMLHTAVTDRSMLVGGLTLRLNLVSLRRRRMFMPIGFALLLRL
jgi:uncharacterized protein (TIGR03435 family)